MPKEKTKDGARKLWPLLQELHALYYVEPKKAKPEKINRSDINLFGDPFERTDFSVFWKRTKRFLNSKPS